MVETFSAVTVKHADGSEESVAALTAYQLRQALLPEKRRKHRNDVSFGHDVEYTAYLSSPRWSARKDSYYRVHPKKCRACGSKKDIHLHHLTYERLGSERDSDLMALCQVCHSKVYKLHARSSVSLRAVTRRYVAEVRAGGRGGGDRRRGQRRLRPCSPPKLKPEFVPANVRLDAGGRVIPSAQFDPVNAAFSD